MTIRPKTLLLSLLLILAVAPLGGCQVLIWLDAVLCPTEPVAAMYEIEDPEEKLILVVVDDRDIDEAVNCARLQEELTEAINVELLANDVVGTAVSFDTIQNLYTSRPQFRYTLPFETMAEMVHADLVLHVRILAFRLKESEEGPIWNGRLETSVRLLSADDTILFPKDRPVDGIAIEKTTLSNNQSASGTYAIQLTHDLAVDQAKKIAKLFYEHDAPRGEQERDKQDLSSEF
jgi:hypothetical protein